MSGIQVGTVSALRLAPDGKSVTITLRLYRPYQIHTDARFVFEQSGFLGDQYVAIVPTRRGFIFNPATSCLSAARPQCGAHSAPLLSTLTPPP
jgi:hypothetical protein